jgi:hypothetical protein
MRTHTIFRALGVWCAILTLGVPAALAQSLAMPAVEDEAKAETKSETKAETPPARAMPVAIGALETAPVIDGRLDDDIWRNAAVLQNFYQVQPGDNAEPSQKTEVLVAKDSKHFYIAFKCYDTEPGRIRASIPKRDQIFDDDYVGAYLDTFNDKQRAYVIFFNPNGIQADGIFTEGRGEDYSVDIVMESKGTVGPDGYTVEVAIPFNSIRYEAGAGKVWGAHFYRRIKRDQNELDSWMPVARNRSGTLVQAGQLTGFEGIDTEHTLELIPSITLSETGRRVPIGGPIGLIVGDRIVNQPLESEIGLTAKFTITPNVTLDFAANPDFAQVEADTLVVTANQRFPIFYEEKRPFFLEGIDYFQSPMNVVNTRAIVDPDVAVKLTGKTGRNTFGLLLASDNAPGNFSVDERDDPAVRPFIEPFLDKNAYIGIVRGKRDFGEDSSLGFFATTYNFIQNHNHLVSVDGRFRVDPKTIFTFQTVGTTSRRSFYDPVEDSSAYRTGNGFGYTANYDYTDRNFGYFVSSTGRTRDYRANVGFTRRTDTNSHELFLRFSDDPRQNKIFVNQRFHTIGGVQHDWSGRIQGWFDESQYRLNFTRGSSLVMGYFTGYEKLYEEEFGAARDANGLGGAFAGTDPTRRSYKNQPFVYGNSTPWRWLNFFGFLGYTWGEFDYDFGGGPKYPRVSPAALAGSEVLDPGSGNALFGEFSATVIPFDALRTTIAYTKSKLTRQDTGLVAFDDNIVSIRALYQFTRFSFVRARFDYDSLSARTYGQYLFGWTPNPGTAFYVGYNDTLNYNGYSPFTGAYEPGLRVNNRTFFVKMSYLFRQRI